MLFNDKVYERIKEAEQADKLSDYFCELEPEGLYMGFVYEAASLIIPHSYIIIDFGCYMAAQAFLFEDFYRYIGIDAFDMKCDPDYIPPRRFYTDNSQHYSMTIQDSCKNMFTDTDCLYAIMSAVPEDGSLTKIVLSEFENAAICYPGQAGIFQGIYANEMRQVTDILRDSRCPYTKTYLRENPEMAQIYREKRLRAERMIDEIVNF